MELFEIELFDILLCEQTTVLIELLLILSNTLNHFYCVKINDS